MEVEQEIIVDANPSNPVLNPSEADKAQPIGEKPEVEEKVEEKPEEKAEEVKKPEPPPIPKGVQKRIDRAVREKYEAEARAKLLEERLEKLERGFSTQNQRPIEDSEPTIDKFDNFDQYVAAKASWIAKKELEATLSERDKRSQAEREQANRARMVDDWATKVAKATADLPDFEDVIAASDVPMTEPMQQAIMESDIGPKLAYWLANNQDEATKIANMSPIGAIRALGRIEERLLNEKPAAKVSNMPPPVPTVKGSSAGVKKDPGKMTDAEYAKWRKSHAA